MLRERTTRIPSPNSRIVASPSFGQTEQLRRSFRLSFHSWCQNYLILRRWKMPRLKFSLSCESLMDSIVIGLRSTIQYRIRPLLVKVTSFTQRYEKALNLWSTQETYLLVVLIDCCKSKSSTSGSTRDNDRKSPNMAARDLIVVSVPLSVRNAPSTVLCHLVWSRSSTSTFNWYNARSQFSRHIRARHASIGPTQASYFTRRHFEAGRSYNSGEFSDVFSCARF